MDRKIDQFCRKKHEKARPIFRKLIASKIELIKTNINKRCSPFRLRQFLKSKIDLENQILVMFEPLCSTHHKIINRKVLWVSFFFKLAVSFLQNLPYF